MDFLTRFGLEKTRLTIFLMVAVILMGALAYQSIPKREDPVITLRTAAVSVDFTGMSPIRVENLIAIPVERKIREIAEVEDIETVITTGNALVYVTLYDATGADEIEEAWEDLRNKMDSVVSELPEGTEGPYVNTEYGDVAIATIAITGDGFALNEIEDTAEEFRKTLYGIEGITKATLYGVQDQRVWLEIDTRKLAAVGVQIGQLLDDLQAQNVILPAGTINAGPHRIVLEANGDLASIEEIEGVLTKVSGLGGYIRLADLVTVRRGYVDPKEKPVFHDGRPAVMVSVEMADSADIQTVGREVLKKVTAFENRQPIGIALSLSTFQETAVTASIESALSNVGQTFVVVFVAMLIFLGVRAASVIACIIPLTITFALIAMGSALEVDIEKVSIAAVIISLGLLVDNGLVIVEDIENRVRAGTDPYKAATTAGAQFITPLAVASVTTVSAFLPMLLIDGTEGDYAYSLGAVVSAMLFGSWITAVYILPYLCAIFLKPTPEQAGKTSWIGDAYEAVLRKILPFSLLLVGGTVGLIVLGLSQFSSLKPEMFPLSERPQFMIYMDMPKGTAIGETERLALRVNQWLQDPEQNPDVSSTTIYVGDGGPRFFLALDPADPDPASAFFIVNLTSFEAALETVDRARRTFIESFPEARFRVARLASGGGESGIVDIEITGPDADVLLAAGAAVEDGFSTIPDLTKHETDWGNKVIKVVLEVAQDKARELGVTSQDIANVMETYFSGTQYSTFRDGDDQIPIVLRAGTIHRDSIEDLSNLSIAAGGQLISLDQVATLHPDAEFSQIRRMNQERQIIISAKSKTLSALTLIDHIQPVLDDLNLGPDYTVTIAGELEDSADVYTDLSANVPFALGVMALALVFQFNSMRRTAITFMTIPIVIIGAPFALGLTDRPMSFFAVLGLISLAGIIINNAIVMINQIDIERESLGLNESIVLAARKRAKPIMLTSVTTICGLVPMAISGGALFEPMATVMIGGLLIASPLTLVVVPALCYLLFSKGETVAEPQTAEV